MTMTRIYLLRHGATAFNRARPYRLQGRRHDPPLDELGIAQATAAAGVLARLDASLAAVYSSPLARALETARLVAGPHGLSPIALPDLIEAELGRWEGRTWEEIAESEPEDYRRFLANPGTVPYPEGESFEEVRRRAGPALLRAAAAHVGRPIAVVGHNVVNRAILAGLLGLPIDLARGIRQANGGINVIEYEDSSMSVVTLNSAFHLDGIKSRFP